MKQNLGKYLLAGGMLLAGAAGAQDNEQQDAQMKKQEAQIKKAEADMRKQEQKAKKGDVQQIIITRTGNDNETTVVEIKGEKVTVNGKDVKDLKDANIDVDINRLKDVDALVTGPRGTRTPLAMTMPRVWNFNNGDGNVGVDFFSEDSTRAMLGVVTIEDEKGARINEVSKESAAEKAGLKQGDIITRINEAKVEDANDVTEQVRKHKPGDKVTVTVLRDGKEQKVVAELTKWKGLKVNAQNFRVMMPGRIAPFEQNDRIDLNDFNFEMNGLGRPRLGLSVQDSEDGKGVVVQDVDGDSNAAKAGIKEGDVITRFNDTEINDVTVLRRELASNKDKISAKIKLLRNGKEQTVDVKMPRKLKTADL
jgi:serine protease Do